MQRRTDVNLGVGSMSVPTDRTHGRDRSDGASAPARGSGGSQPRSARLDQIAAADPASADLIRRLLGIAVRNLPQSISAGQFAFRLDGRRQSDGTWLLTPAGTSPRYAAIAALGLLRLPEPGQRSVLGESCSDLVGRLTARLEEVSGLGDLAMLTWAAAECGHDVLPQALARLGQLDDPQRPAAVVDAAWVVSALVAARGSAGVEQHLERARSRLLAARDVLYPHVTGDGQPWFRSHVGSFADQVYPLQALARLHHSADDPQALAAAAAVAAAVCAAQGEAGQWWWHYDSRSGAVVEGYPVYSVHQHAMAPMALLDLGEAGGDAHLESIARGLRWLASPPETAEALILDEPATTWRKVARPDHRKAVRGLRAASTRIHPGWRLPVLDKVFPAGVVDYECRPYELGWLLMTWLS
jgi:hypothetical protein